MSGCSSSTYILTKALDDLTSPVPTGIFKCKCHGNIAPNCCSFLCVLAHLYMCKKGTVRSVTQFACPFSLTIERARTKSGGVAQYDPRTAVLILSQNSLSPPPYKCHWFYRPSAHGFDPCLRLPIFSLPSAQFQSYLFCKLVRRNALCTPAPGAWRHLLLSTLKLFQGRKNPEK